MMENDHYGSNSVWIKTLEAQLVQGYTDLVANIKEIAESFASLYL